MLKRIHPAFIAAAIGFMCIPAIADPPPPPPPAPAGTYSEVHSRAIAISSFPNPLYGNACIETDRLEITKFSVTIPPPGDADNAPDDGAAIVFVLPVNDSKLEAHLGVTFTRCSGDNLPGNVDAVFPFASGTYSTSGALTVAYGTYIDSPYVINVSVAGTLTNWSRSATVTFARTDPRDPNLGWKSTAAAIFDDGPPPKSKKKPPAPVQTPMLVKIVK